MADERIAVSVTKADRVRPISEAFQLVERDAAEGLIDADLWGDSVPDAEKVRVLAEAYCGRLDINGNGGDSR